MLIRLGKMFNRGGEMLNMLSIGSVRCLIVR